ncbi:unnamed protein product, partial [Oppiella nova]
MSWKSLIECNIVPQVMSDSPPNVCQVWDKCVESAHTSVCPLIGVNEMLFTDKGSASNNLSLITVFSRPPKPKLT